MQYKTSDLSGIALDWTVACAKGYSKPALTISGNIQGFLNMHEDGYHNYSVDWSQAGPIIDREEITVCWQGAQWVGSKFNVRVAGEYEFQNSGPTPLVAAMRCYVASKLGDIIEVPDELVITCN